MEISTDIVHDINHHHGIAITQAKVALEHAKAAGKLLLEVKDSLPTGQLGDWLEANVSVPLKQAQHYISAAEGTPVPIRQLSWECDALSPVTETSERREFRPSFIPLMGFSYLYLLEKKCFYLIESARSFPGFHFVCTWETRGKREFSYLRGPIQAIAVEFMLQKLKLQDPAATDWHWRPIEGVNYAGESVGFLLPENERCQK
jgi:hypothetical protein